MTKECKRSEDENATEEERNTSPANSEAEEIGEGSDPAIALLQEEAYLEEEESSSKGSKRGMWLVVVACILVAVGGFGYFGNSLGAGWFFHRTILYSSGELYALNLGEKPLWISVDGKPSLEVNPNDARIVQLLGGNSSVEVREAENGPVVKTYSITTDHSNALLKLTPDGCLVAVDLDPYYGAKKRRTPDDEIIFTDKLEAKDQIWVPGSYNVVWPRKTFPPRLAAGEGPGRWIELVACTLLGDTDDDRKFLDAYIALRLQERMKAALGGERRHE